jgi:hypothetical protein
MASPYPVRAVQRNLHHQLLRSGVLITGSNRAGMSAPTAGDLEPAAGTCRDAPRPVRHDQTNPTKKREF